jgi:hypothetical protein
VARQGRPRARADRRALHDPQRRRPGGSDSPSGKLLLTAST